LGDAGDRNNGVKKKKEDLQNQTEGLTGRPRVRLKRKAKLLREKRGGEGGRVRGQEYGGRTSP